MTSEVVIPPDQVSRQAIASLRGYIYQIYQSVEAWIDLTDDEVLLLEVAEDFAVVTKDALKGSQIKDVGGSVTLKNEGVRKTLDAYWAFKDANPKKSVSSVFVTTASVGKEKGVNFPDNAKGLEYWQHVARDGVETRPLRDYLSTLQLSDELINFIANSSDDEFRSSLLRQVTWSCESPDITILEQNLRDKVTYFGERTGLGPSDSDKGFDALVSEIIYSIVKPQPLDRRLTRAEFLRAFENATSTRVPNSTLRASLAGQGTIDSDVTQYSDQIPLIENRIARADIVSSLTSKLSQDGVLWLFGSSGLGKTQLALRIARRSDRKWLLLSLRDCANSRDVDSALSSAFRAISSDDVAGIILDDMPVQHLSRSNTRFLQLSKELGRKSATLIVTAYQAPAATLTYLGGGLEVCAYEVPYLSIQEVEEFINNFGGNAKWAELIHTFSHSGHPTLIHAKLSGLKLRGWPIDELKQEYDSLGTKNVDVKEQRQAIRQRLIDELPEPARVLLDRLSLIIGYFDLETAKSLAGIAPSVNRPGEHLSVLCGPWLEAKGNDQYTISPLIGDIGNRNLTTAEMNLVHNAMVGHLLSLSPFPAQSLNQLFCHALIGQNEAGLAWVARAICEAKLEDRNKLAKYTFLFPILSGFDNRPIFPKSIHLSFMLRLAQFHLTASSDRTERLRPIFDRLLVESKLADEVLPEAGTYYLSLSTGLMELNLQIGPKEWIPLMLDLSQHLSEENLAADLAKVYSQKSRGEGPDWDIIQTIFASRALQTGSVSKLQELFGELDTLDRSVRDHLLSALADPIAGQRLMVHSAWSSAYKTETYDPLECINGFRSVAQMADQWGQRDISIECECARVVILSEHIGDSAAAHNSLDEARKIYGDDPRFTLHKAKIYFGNQNHEDALEAYRSEVSHLDQEDYIENAFLLRQAAVSAGHCVEWLEASEYFRKAQEFAEHASSGAMAHMARGLVADRAVAKFLVGEFEEAVALLLEAVRKAKPKNVADDREEKLYLIMLAHTVTWMRSQQDGWPAEKLYMFPGAVSNPDPNEEIYERPAPDFLLLLYQLAEFEAQKGIGDECLSYLREHTEEGEIPTYELILNNTLIERCYKDADIRKFTVLLKSTITHTVFFEKNKRSMEPFDVLSPKRAQIPDLSNADWKSEVVLRIIYIEVLAFSCLLATSGKPQLIEPLQVALMEVYNDWFEEITFFDDLKSPINSADRAETAAAAAIGLLMEQRVTPKEALMLSYRLWAWFVQSDRRLLVEPLLAYKVVQLWNGIIRNQRFAIFSPNISIPPIEKAIADTSDGLKKVANIIVAAEGAVGANLGPEIRKQLREYGG